MPKLVRIDDPSVGVQGTLEIVPAIALVDAHDDGKISWQGYTEVDWDSQKTMLNRKGERLFIDENGDKLRASLVAIQFDDGRVAPIDERDLG